jgi:hypothetical protein
MMKGEFGFHRGGGEHETGTAAYVQIYVKSSALSRAPDLAISAHLMTEAKSMSLWMMHSPNWKKSASMQRKR